MVELIAHRGASKEAPENTLASFSKALEIGVDWIEMDVHLSKDGIPVVLHDAFPGRTARGETQGRITDLSLAQIKALDAGSWFNASFTQEKIPTLKETLSLDNGATGWMIEIKKGHSFVKPLVSTILEVVGHQTPQRFRIGSSSPHIIEEIRTQDPGCPLIGIVEDFNMAALFEELNLPYLAIWYKLANPAWISRLHEKGCKVWAFTVDDPKIAEFLASIGIDGIITNNPRDMKALTCFK